MILPPSLLAADSGNLQQAVQVVNVSEADQFHIDITGGVSIPNISYGILALSAIGKHTTKSLDVHLMIIDSDRYISTFAKLGSHILTVYYEACIYLHRTLQVTKAESMKAGVAFNPHTPVALLKDIIKDVGLLLLMDINPGFGGQSFIENTYKKVRQARVLITQMGTNALIEIDGGVTLGNARAPVEAGIDVLVAGSLAFNTANPTQTVTELKAKT